MRMKYWLRPSAFVLKWLKCVILPLFGVILVALQYQSKFMCTNSTIHQVVKDICSKYKDGKSVGSMCQELCDTKEEPLTCHMTTDTIFWGNLMNTSVVMKFAKLSLDVIMPTNYDQNYKQIYLTEAQFSFAIQQLVLSKFNLSLHSIDAQRLSYLKFRPEKLNRHVEMEDMFTLLVDNEYLALTLYEKYNIFPKILGSCGYLYAVQKLDSISGFWHLMTLYDSQEEWEKRIKVSLMIMDYLLVLENNVPEPLIICHMKMSHFGVTNDFKRVMYLSLDTVHPVSVANKITSNKNNCKQHSDCDYLDCRSFCNLITEECQYGVVNNNLQMVCERIFLGWAMSGRVLIPGLLLGPRTPRFLVELLETCANPSGEAGTPRAQATMEIRNRLYNFLRHLL